MVDIGSPCTYVDPTGQHHAAVVTAVHGYNSVEERNADYTRQAEKARQDAVERGTDIPHWASEEQQAANAAAPYYPPSVNVVFVVSDPAKTDSYGRQIERATSVPAKTVQPAHGMYYFC